MGDDRPGPLSGSPAWTAGEEAGGRGVSADPTGEWRAERSLPDTGAVDLAVPPGEERVGTADAL